MKMKLLLTVFVFIPFFQLSAQVAIGTVTKAEDGALLEVKEKQVDNPNGSNMASLENSKKGILFPKVMLVAKDQLAPLYGKPTGNPDATSCLRATGMVVYNVNKDATNLEVGFYYWDGEMWLRW